MTKLLDWAYLQGQYVQSSHEYTCIPSNYLFQKLENGSKEQNTTTLVALIFSINTHYHYLSIIFHHNTLFNLRMGSNKECSLVHPVLKKISKMRYLQTWCKVRLSLKFVGLQSDLHVNTKLTV